MQTGNLPDTELGHGDYTLEISILIATHSRPDSLAATLQSLAECTLGEGEFNVIVCDNADDERTRDICARFADELSVEYLVERTPGKNNALNAGLRIANGELLLFTDDDVLVREDWIRSMWKAANSYPENNIFGGQVLPIWPVDFPTYLRESQYRGICFAIVDLDLATGPSHDFAPFGPNIGIRRTVFDRGLRYNPEVGPTQESYIMGSETSLIRELKKLGEVPVFVSDSSVNHRVRPEQASISWLVGRGIRYGRMLEFRAAAEFKGTGWSGPFPAWIIRQLATEALAGLIRFLAADKKGSFEAVFRASITWGRLHQFRLSSKAVEMKPAKPSENS